jgi:hypothetical protein
VLVLCFSAAGLETNVSVSVLIPYFLKYKIRARGKTFAQVHGFISLQVTLCEIK